MRSLCVHSWRNSFSATTVRSVAELQLGDRSDFQRLECSLQAVQKLLGQLQGQPCFQEVAKTQASNIEKLLGNSPAMPAEGATRLNELVLSSAFPADIKNRLVARISNSSTTTVSRGFQRTKQQDFQTIFEYLPVDASHTLASSEVTDCAKLEILVDLSMKHGHGHG